jgi:hypothetical protein
MLNVTVGRATATGTSNAKRDAVVGFEISEQLNKNAFTINTERCWWLGVIMTSIGGVVLIYS